MRREHPVILHILPEYGIGGAEGAAKAAAEASSSIYVLFLRRPATSDVRHHPRVVHGTASTAFGPAALRSTFQALRSVDPDVVVFSLWHTWVAFLLARILFPRKSVAVLLHSDRPVHIFDRIWTWTSAFLSDAVWADSTRSMERVAKRYRAGRHRTLSFVVRPISAAAASEPGPRFVSWSRLTDVKNYPLSLELVAKVRDDFPNLSYDIIGPDGGALPEIRRKIVELKLEDHVRLLGPADFAKIAEVAAARCFFLQLSKYEGMAISVVEAMQLGLVPIVTPVGEPAVYCEQGVNAVVFSNVERTAGEIASLLDDRSAFGALRRRAIGTWSNAPLYSDDIVAAARELHESRLGSGGWLKRLGVKRERSGRVADPGK